MIFLMHLLHEMNDSFNQLDHFNVYDMRMFHAYAFDRTFMKIASENGRIG